MLNLKNNKLSENVKKKKTRHDETTVCYQALLSELSPFDKLHLTSFQQNKEALLP
jgi:hypothetical protein